jgi:hypothetical protein
MIVHMDPIRAGFPGTVARTVPECPAKIRLGTPNALGFFQVIKNITYLIMHMDILIFHSGIKHLQGQGSLQPTTNRKQYNGDRLSNSVSGLRLRMVRNGYVKKGQ